MSSLPHSYEAEESVIGGLLFDGRAADDVLPLLEPSDFYDARNEAICAAMKEAHGRGVRLDLITVSAELRRMGLMGRLEPVGQEAFLVELSNRVATSSNLVDHATIVRDKRIARHPFIAPRGLDPSHCSPGHSSYFLARK